MAATATKSQTPATEPATPLERLYCDRAGLTGELAALNASSAKLHAAANAEASVVAEITALGAAEIESMTKWGRAGCIGDAPRADQNKRIMLGQKLNAAQASAAAAVGAGQDIGHEITQLTAQLHDISERIEQAVLDCIERDHDEVIAEYAKACEIASKCATRIAGLASFHRDAGHLQRAAAIIGMKLPKVTTSPTEVQAAANDWSRRAAALRSGSAS